MKISVDTKSLMDSLRKVLNIVSPRTTLPVLNNILLTADKTGLSLSTTDLEISIVTRLEANVSEEGEVTIPAKKFSQIIGTFTEGEVALESGSDMVTSIACGSAKFKIMGLNPTEFPRQTEFKEQQKIVFNKRELAGTLRKIGYAVSNDQTRIVLNGILMSIHDNSITMVATDGRRLALVEKVVNTSDKLVDGDIILPTKVVNELQKVMDGDGDVVIKLSESQASFDLDNTVITSKLIEGSYPNYRQVIPASFNNSVILPREKFNEILNRVALVLSETGASVKFKLETDLLTLSAASSEIGEAQEPVELSFQGDPVTISFNPVYLNDPLKNLECDDFTMRFNDEFKPVVVLGDEGFLYVIMPMRN